MLMIGVVIKGIQESLKSCEANPTKKKEDFINRQLWKTT